MTMMGRIGRWVSDHPWTAIAAIVALTVLSMASIQYFGLEQEFSEEAFMPDMEISQASNEISEHYTATYSVSVLVRSQDGDLLTPESLVEILRIEKAFVEDPDIVPTLETPALPSVNVNSVADIIAQMALLAQNVTNPTMDQKIMTLQAMDAATLKQLIGNILASDQTPLQVKGVFTILLTKDFDPASGAIKAKGTILSLSLNASMSQQDGSGTDTPLVRTEQAMDDIVKATELTHVRMRVMGGNIIMDEILVANNDSLAILLPLAMILVVIVLMLIYRSGRDMLYSLLALGFAIVWVYGFGAAMGYSFNPMTTAVPILLVGLGIDYGIHLTMRYREELREGKTIEGSITTTVKSVGMALLLATVTTVVAFLSNVASPIELLAQFGILSAVGIVGSFFTMVMFVPACKQLSDRRRLSKGKPIVGMNNNTNNAKNGANNGNAAGNGLSKLKTAGVTVLDRAMTSGAVAAERHPMGVIAVVTMITFASVAGASLLETRFDFQDFLPEDLPISDDLDFMLSEFTIAGGEAQEGDILVKGDLTDPALLRAVRQTTEGIADDESVLKPAGHPQVETILTYMQDWATNTSLYGLQDANYHPEFEVMYNATMTPEGVPGPNATKADVKALYDWLYLNPMSHKSLKTVLHRSESMAYVGTVIRIDVDLDANDKPAVEKLVSDLDRDKRPLDAVADKAIITSGPILTKVIMDLLNSSQIRSLIITIIVSLIVLTAVFWTRARSLVLGAITLTPVIFCVTWTLGAMYIMEIPLNVMTITIASLTVGLGITYGIHITHRFLEDLERHKTIYDATVSTVSHTGTALFGAAATTIAGFGLLVFALLPPIQQFGGITALTILFSFLSSVFILPTFLMLWAKRRANHAEK